VSVLPQFFLAFVSGNFSQFAFSSAGHFSVSLSDTEASLRNLGLTAAKAAPDVQNSMGQDGQNVKWSNCDIISVCPEPVAKAGYFCTGSCGFSSYGRGRKSGKTETASHYFHKKSIIPAWVFGTGWEKLLKTA
jgi:hypothetical protein